MLMPAVQVVHDFSCKRVASCWTCQTANIHRSIELWSASRWAAASLSRRRLQLDNGTMKPPLSCKLDWLFNYCQAMHNELMLLSLSLELTVRTSCI